MSELDVLTVGIPPAMIQNWGWFLTLGMGLVLLGIAAVIQSMKTTIISMLFFGWLLVMAAGIEAAQAFLVGKWAGLFLHLLAAVLFGVTGALLVWRPAISADVVTLLMSMFFLLSGLFQLVSSLLIHLPGWGWHTLDGIITFVLGVFILTQWPVSDRWTIGLFVGIDLVFYGCAWVALALDLHKM